MLEELQCKCLTTRQKDILVYALNITIIELDKLMTEAKEPTLISAYEREMHIADGMKNIIKKVPACKQ